MVLQYRATVFSEERHEATPVRLDSCSAGRRRREAQLLRGGAAAWRAVQGAGGRRSVVSAQREGTRRSGRNRGNEELSSVFSCRLVSPGGRSVRRGRPSRTDRNRSFRSCATSAGHRSTNE